MLHNLRSIDTNVINVQLIVELVVWYMRCGGIHEALSVLGAGGARGARGTGGEESGRSGREGRDTRDSRDTRVYRGDGGGGGEGRRMGENETAESATEDGAGMAVLVFLPGTREIQDVQEALLSTQLIARDPTQASWVLALHGGLPPEQQKQVFNRPPPGIVKVVLSTNVAETSVTIDDVGFCIDAGRVKEQR